ncbi:hypothetical protein ERO13_D07G202900v2 [Gossypium hirsutum]|nr:hypothetical protein ERO13_D07G202900v2 [Gossypium hirsutum]
MISLTPYLSLPTTSAFTSKAKKLSISPKPATSPVCCSYSRYGLKLSGRKGYCEITKSTRGGLFVFACSTTPYVRRVGSRRLSFGSNAGGGATQVSKKVDLSQVLSAMLPFVVAITAVAALVQPSTFTWVSKDLYAPALGGIMLSIGIRLSFDDFTLAFKRPLPLSVGFIAQYLLKPALGVLVAKAFCLSPTFYAGFILTSCVAGAQLSSYASF